MMFDAEKRVCANCKHHEYDEDQGKHLCRRYKGQYSIDIVTGEKKYYQDPIDCRKERDEAFGACGYEGHQYVPKDGLEP